MAQSTIYDLLEKTLKSMSLPASTNDVYVKLTENGAYKHMSSIKARKIISAKLCYMRDKGLLVSHIRADGKTAWNFTITNRPGWKPDIFEQQPADNTQVLHDLFLSLSSVFAKAAYGLSHDK